MSEKVDEIIAGIKAYENLAQSAKQEYEANGVEEVFAQMHNGNAYQDENGLTIADQIYGDAAKDFAVTD